MRQEEQISRYFDHAMTSGEEQNFLITLAASDAMRLAFRSQLELMKAVRSDADSLRMDQRLIRDRTLTALGLSATAVTPFIEQELVGSAHAQGAVAAPLRGILSRPKYALGTGLFLGFLSAVAVMNITPKHLGQPTPVVQSVTQPASPAVAPLTHETIPASNGLHNVTDERSFVAAGHPSSHARHAQATNVSTRTSATPEVLDSKPAQMDVKPIIKKPADDRSPVDNSTKAP
ncbi:MAG: hypothetical protein Q8922_05905 [Bacteroidota bacterium]|nr:hypothetical protein [Bacteroidota bacterium]MDP4234084.1 hypothetical protein [Bacteroidota bacterium]MDP4243025.1 hypothetical protein [Bacteroidota bacterium]MDP4287451.1 hypothetical protein [Bacteroidota bacterium]